MLLAVAVRIYIYNEAIKILQILSDQKAAPAHSGLILKLQSSFLPYRSIDTRNIALGAHVLLHFRQMRIRHFDILHLRARRFGEIHGVLCVLAR